MAKAEVKKVELEVVAAEDSKVFVAGTFNNWDAKKTPLKPTAKPGVFKTSLSLAPGRHEYKFVVNGAWMDDPSAKDRVTNSCGSQNSVLTV